MLVNKVGICLMVLPRLRRRSHHRSAGQEETRLQILALLHIGCSAASVFALCSLRIPKDSHPNPPKSPCKAKLILTKLYPSVINLKLEKWSFFLYSLEISLPKVPHQTVHSKVPSCRHHKGEDRQSKSNSAIESTSVSLRKEPLRMFEPQSNGEALV